MQTRYYQIYLHVLCSQYADIIGVLITGFYYEENTYKTMLCNKRTPVVKTMPEKLSDKGNFQQIWFNHREVMVLPWIVKIK